MAFSTPSHTLQEVDYFFGIYKELEGKKSDTYGWEDRVVAYQVIQDFCIRRYKDPKEGLIDRWCVLTEEGEKAVASGRQVMGGRPEEKLNQMTSTPEQRTTRTRMTTRTQTGSR